MSALIKDITNEPRIYESIRRIYDIQSSSEDSLDHRKRCRSLIKNSRATRTASLFIDRLRNEFRRGDDFVPRFRSHRNWCPKFPSKYFCEREEGECSTSLGKSILKNFIHETPKIYSIGLYEPKMRRRVNDDGERVGVIDIGDTVEYFKHRSLFSHRTPENDIANDPPCENTNWKKRIPTLPSFATLSIPLISSFPIPMNCLTKSSRKRRVTSYDRSYSPKKDDRIHMKSTSLPKIKSFEKDHRKISKKRICSSEYDSTLQRESPVDDFDHCSVSQKNFVRNRTFEPNKDARIKEEFTTNERSTCFDKLCIPSEKTLNDFIKHERIIVNVINCKTSEEFLRDGSPDKLVEDIFLEEISIGSSTSNYKEFFSPIDSPRETKTNSKEQYRENEILEDIRRRIDEDFKSSLKLDEDFENFHLSGNTKFHDETYSLDSDIFLDLEDDLLTGIEQSKSMPMITSTVTKRRSSKSVTLVSSTLVEDDFYDQKSPRITLSKETLKEYRTIESNDSRYPSCTDLSSMNSIICQSTYDFPSTYLESTIISPGRIIPTASIDRRNFDVHDKLSRTFSISDVSMSNEYESASSSNDVSRLCISKEQGNILISSRDEYETTVGSDYELSKTNLTKGFLRSTPLKERISSKNLVESIDSGVMMDYSRNDIHACGSIAQRNTNAFYIYGNQFEAKASNDLPMFDFDSDSTHSDDSLDRRVDMAVQKCTEDLILLERRMKIKFKMIENHMNESTNDFLTYFDWNSGDERIGSISTPSLVSLTDSEKS